MILYILVSAERVGLGLNIMFRQTVEEEALVAAAKGEVKACINHFSKKDNTKTW